MGWNELDQSNYSDLEKFIAEHKAFEAWNEKLSDGERSHLEGIDPNLKYNDELNLKGIKEGDYVLDYIFDNYEDMEPKDVKELVGLLYTGSTKPENVQKGV